MSLFFLCPSYPTTCQPTTRHGTTRQYDQLATSLDDYADIAVGFGYTALFVSALPAAALFSMVSVALEVRADGWKLLHLYKRPFPKSCENIGTWYVFAICYFRGLYGIICEC
jgi:hypothetical protein